MLVLSCDSKYYVAKEGEEATDIAPMELMSEVLLSKYDFKSNIKAAVSRSCVCRHIKY